MCLPADGNVRMREDKSFANDLDVQRGIVSSRVALLLRSAEIKPLLSDLLLLATKAAVRGCGLRFRRILFGADGGGEWAGRGMGGSGCEGRVLCILPRGVMGGCPRADGRPGEGGRKEGRFFWEKGGIFWELGGNGVRRGGKVGVGSGNGPYRGGNVWVVGCLGEMGKDLC